MRHLMFSALVLAMGMTAQAGHKKPCAPTCAPCPKPACEYKVVECKVMVPEWTSETKTITCIEYHQEKQERTVKYREMVPTKETKTKDGFRFDTAMVEKKQLQLERTKSRRTNTRTRLTSPTRVVKAKIKAAAYDCGTLKMFFQV